MTSISRDYQDNPSACQLLEDEVLSEINKLRLNPVKYADIVESYIQYFEGDALFYKDQDGI